MRKISEEESRDQVNAILLIRKHSRTPGPEPYRDLLPYAAEILAWANVPGASKAILSALCKQHLKLKINGDRIYRFVKHINGSWPNSKNGKREGD